jgi:hypothetical protein
MTIMDLAPKFLAGGRQVRPAKKLTPYRESLKGLKTISKGILDFSHKALTDSLRKNHCLNFSEATAG